MITQLLKFPSGTLAKTIRYGTGAVHQPLSPSRKQLTDATRTRKKAPCKDYINTIRFFLLHKVRFGALFSIKQGEANCN
ncbi:hypothetical protein NIES4071_105360 (plasmid) [Calothrix sp. NIES-4071]|nr:hypothetical protein NIES4071_105360 [Calothrix sp. NIES-4071]BAZ64954.1 hypothetical protein NIES4105_106870 [Calothrix sp. NIES-4105]